LSTYGLVAFAAGVNVAPLKQPAKNTTPNEAGDPKTSEITRLDISAD